MRKTPHTQQRQFLGKTENFKDNNESRFHQRMLRAYLAGHKFFHFVYEYMMNQRFPKRHEVLQTP